MEHFPERDGNELAHTVPTSRIARVRMEHFPERDGNKEITFHARGDRLSRPNGALPWKGWKHFVFARFIRINLERPNGALPWKGWKHFSCFPQYFNEVFQSEWSTSLKGMETGYLPCCQENLFECPNGALPWKGWKLFASIVAAVLMIPGPNGALPWKGWKL